MRNFRKVGTAFAFAALMAVGSGTLHAATLSGPVSQGTACSLLEKAIAQLDPNCFIAQFLQSQYNKYCAQ